MRYDGVVSLGGNCEVAQHWRRWSGIEAAAPFDWLITPFASVGKMFEQRFAGMAELDNMEVVNRGRTVMCQRYGVGHHHDFERLPDVQIDRADMPRACARAKEKYDFLASRMMGRLADAQRTLFIRSWRDDLDPGAPNAQAPDGLVRYDFNLFIDRIQAGVQHDRFDVLFVNYGVQRCDHPRARFHNVHDHADAVDWSGSVKGWDEMFELYAR